MPAPAPYLPTTEPAPAFESVQPVALEAGAEGIAATGVLEVEDAAAPFLSTVNVQTTVEHTLASMNLSFFALVAGCWTVTATAAALNVFDWLTE